MSNISNHPTPQDPRSTPGSALQGIEPRTPALSLKIFPQLEPRKWPEWAIASNDLADPKENDDEDEDDEYKTDADWWPVDGSGKEFDNRDVR